MLKVPSGETVRIRTKDCFGNQLQGPEDQLSEIDWEAINPATGPIYVEGAVAGGTLKVHIDNIELDAQTSSCTGKDEGVCGDRFSDWATHFCKVEDGKVVWDERLSIPLAPMIGVIGVAPEGEPVNCGTPGKHGGQHGQYRYFRRCDAVFPRCRRRCAVRVRRHACCHGRWRGQRIGRGSCRLCDGDADRAAELSVPNPLIENETHFGIIVSAESLDKAAKLAVQQMVDLLASRTNESEADLVMLLSLVADVRVCQMVDPEKTVRFMVPKYVLDAIGFSL